MPAHAAWFSYGSVHANERSQLPEFFANQKSAKVCTPRDWTTHDSTIFLWPCRVWLRMMHRARKWHEQLLGQLACLLHMHASCREHVV